MTLSNTTITITMESVTHYLTWPLNVASDRNAWAILLKQSRATIQVNEFLGLNCQPLAAADDDEG